MQDRYSRTIDYMRVSVTDRCNLRCRYCMPEDIGLSPMKDVMTYEETVRICACAAKLGITKLRITGGEPLVRKDCAKLVGMLKETDGIEQVMMTTNGVLLKQNLPALVNAGLDAVNISLDTLSAERFAAITGRDELDAVLNAIDASLEAGLRTKINTVLCEGINADEWLSLAQLAKDRPLDVRFIEMMPIGYGKAFGCVDNGVLLARLTELYPALARDHAVHGSGPAVYVHIPGWRGSVGFISAIHSRFCASCSRVRLTSKGALKPCLCYGETKELLPLVRGGASEEELREAMAQAIYEKPREHCFEEPDRITETARMSGIGG